jgi:hypothetical protein
VFGGPGCQVDILALFLWVYCYLDAVMYAMPVASTRKAPPIVTFLFCCTSGRTRWAVRVSRAGDLVSLEMDDNGVGGFLAAEGFADRKLFVAMNPEARVTGSFRGGSLVSMHATSPAKAVPVGRIVW